MKRKSYKDILTWVQSCIQSSKTYEQAIAAIRLVRLFVQQHCFTNDQIYDGWLLADMAEAKLLSIQKEQP